MLFSRSSGNCNQHTSKDILRLFMLFTFYQKELIKYGRLFYFKPQIAGWEWKKYIWKGNMIVYNKKGICLDTRNF